MNDQRLISEKKGFQKTKLHVKTGYLHIYFLILHLLKNCAFLHSILEFSFFIYLFRYTEERYNKDFLVFFFISSLFFLDFFHFLPFISSKTLSHSPQGHIAGVERDIFSSLQSFPVPEKKDSRFRIFRVSFNFLSFHFFRIEVFILYFVLCSTFSYQKM